MTMASRGPYYPAVDSITLYTEIIPHFFASQKVPSSGFRHGDCVVFIRPGLAIILCGPGRGTWVLTALPPGAAGLRSA